MEVIQWLEDAAPVVVFVVTATIVLVAVGHVILHKRDPRSAAGWVGVILVSPGLGAILYTLFGINRIRRRAHVLRRHARDAEPIFDRAATAEELVTALGPRGQHLVALAKLTDKAVQRWPLVAGNRIEPLYDGDEAFPAMLAAISEATQSIALSTYIFDLDSAGIRFANALVDARRRGVVVRVLIDAVGARYSFPTMVGYLRRCGIPVARFTPTWFPWRLAYANLRNHRKILVCDGKAGFIGGMNIRLGHCLRENPPHPVTDIHFKCEGPVVAHLVDAFTDDWFFSTREVLKGDIWFPPPSASGSVMARGVPDGPDGDFEKIRLTLLGGLAIAKHSVVILCPYFLPDQGLIAAMIVAVMRGVTVKVVVPGRNNLLMVQWAGVETLLQLIEAGIEVRRSPPPFCHSKLVVIDGLWSFVGSSNIDPRSLRLNFELNIECYDSQLGVKLTEYFDNMFVRSEPVTAEALRQRNLLTRLRDGFARLLSPYL